MALPASLDVQRLSTGLSQPIAINTEARTCLSNLEKICRSLRVLTPDEAITAGFERHVALLNFQDALAKFRAWGVNVAAFRGESHPTSLHFRLRDAPDIRSRVCQVLEELQEYLHDC